MKYKIKKPIRVDGIKYKIGDTVEIPEEYVNYFLGSKAICRGAKSKKSNKINKVYTKEELEGLKFPAIRQIGYKFNVKDNDKITLIEEILKAQEER